LERGVGCGSKFFSGVKKFKGVVLGKSKKKTYPALRKKN